MHLFLLLFLAAQSPTELLSDPTVRAAMEAARRNEPQILDLQVRVCEIPAPPFHEEARGRELARLVTELGLKDVRTDKAGNVIGVRPGKAAHPNLVFSAHLDAVFPEGTDVKVTREGDKAPGIGDDCRGLAVMLGVIRALNDAHVETPGTITFVADVGEEGLGDLRKMKSLFYDSLKGQIDQFISVDGIGLGILMSESAAIATRSLSKDRVATAMAPSAWPIRFRRWAAPSRKSMRSRFPRSPRLRLT